MSENIPFLPRNGTETLAKYRSSICQAQFGAGMACFRARTLSFFKRIASVSLARMWGKHLSEATWRRNGALSGLNHPVSHALEFWQGIRRRSNGTAPGMERLSVNVVATETIVSETVLKHQSAKRQSVIRRKDYGINLTCPIYRQISPQRNHELYINSSQNHHAP